MLLALGLIVLLISLPLLLSVHEYAQERQERYRAQIHYALNHMAEQLRAKKTQQQDIEERLKQQLQSYFQLQSGVIQWQILRPDGSHLIQHPRSLPRKGLSHYSQQLNLGSSALYTVQLHYDASHHAELSFAPQMKLMAMATVSTLLLTLLLWLVARRLVHKTIKSEIDRREQAEVAFRHSEEKYRNLFANIGSGVAVYQAVEEGEDFVFVDMNKAGERYSQVHAKDLLGRKVTDCFPGIREMGLLETFKEVWRTGEPKHHPLRLYHDNRVQQWVENYVFKLDSGEVVAVYDDVSDIKRAQEELRKSEERFAYAMQGANDGLWDWDILNQSLYYSPRWKSMLGYSEDELANDYESWSKNVHPEDVQRAEASIQHVLQHKEEGDYQCEFRMRHKAGHYIDILSRGFLIRDEAGNPSRMVGTHIDLTSRKEIERALADYSQRLELATRAGGIGVWEWDVVSGELHWDERQFEIYGISREEFTHEISAWKRAVHPEDLAAAEAHVKRALAGEEIFERMFRILWPDGSERTIKAAAVVVRDESAKPMRMIGVNWDITVEKEQEKQLLGAIREAEKANMAKTEFLAHMSHDIRTPLNAVMGMGELLAESPLNDEQHDQLKVLRRSSGLLLNLINDVLDISKIEAGQLVLERAAFSLQSLIQDSVEVVQLAAETKGLATVVRLDSELPDNVIGDAQRLTQILYNLLSNAVKFTQQGQITLEVIPAGDARITFNLQDTGIGVDKSHLDKIFEPFNQVRGRGNQHTTGTGLGLAICRNLVEIMGGEISATSLLDQGSTFTFTIPLPAVQSTHTQGADADSTSSVSITEKQRDLEVAKVSARRLLLVDDSEDNRTLIKAFLKGTAHEAIYAENGEEALALAKQGGFDLILMDIQMPVMDGHEATRQIRRWECEKGVSSTPIVALTANATKEDRDKALQAGCAGHLTKPIRKRRLLEAIIEHTLEK
uniref:histidine kinase n=1 Tax=Magnetococcus massalia (strain MO-1) TaxID=451514 RepID=A0A1S7LEE9_MAGMO|nr:putative Histidine kinase [Candidatus Magnetococcus massalia]